MPKKYTRPEQVIDPRGRYLATISTDRGEIEDLLALGFMIGRSGTGHGLM